MRDFAADLDYADISPNSIELLCARSRTECAFNFWKMPAIPHANRLPRRRHFDQLLTPIRSTAYQTHQTARYIVQSKKLFDNLIYIMPAMLTLSMLPAEQIATSNALNSVSCRPNRPPSRTPYGWFGCKLLILTLHRVRCPSILVDIVPGTSLPLANFNSVPYIFISMYIYNEGTPFCGTRLNRQL